MAGAAEGAPNLGSRGQTELENLQRHLEDVEGAHADISFLLKYRKVRGASAPATAEECGVHVRNATKFPTALMDSSKMLSALLPKEPKET